MNVASTEVVTKRNNCIAVLRSQKGISRRTLAEALGVNYQTIGYLERGKSKPNLALALRIAEYFEVPLTDVFFRQSGNAEAQE